VGGDFNTHHPVWNPEGYTHHDEEANALVDMMAELELTLLLPPGTVTYPNAGTMIDLVWGSNEAANHTITCRIAEEHDHSSDHLPIETTIAMQIEEPQFLPTYDYAKTNWKELNNKLELYLPNLSAINEEAITNADCDEDAKQLDAFESSAVTKDRAKLRAFRKSMGTSGWNQEWGKHRSSDDMARGMGGTDAISPVVLTKADEMQIERSAATAL